MEINQLIETVNDLEKRLALLETNPSYLTIDQAQAELAKVDLHITGQTVRNWAKAGKFKTLATKPGQSLRIDRSSFLEYINEKGR